MSSAIRLPFYATPDDVDVPGGWSVTRIVDAYEQLPVGQRYDIKSVSTSGDVPVIDQSQRGILGYHDNEPGVVASRGNPVVTFANHTCAMRVMRAPFSVIQNVFPLVGRPGICDTIYLYYATNGRQQTEEYKGHHPAWRNSYIALPDVGVQKKIVQILGSLDELIEKNRRRAEVLEEVARAIYREWFLHLRYPGHGNATLADSSLGPLPDRWTVTTLGQVLELRYGKALKKENRRGGSVAVVSSAGVVGWHDEGLTTGPTIVVGRKGNVGSVTWVDGPAWPIDTAYYVETDLPLRYVVEQLRRTEFLNTHAAVPGLSREQAYSRPFVQPPDDLMAQFDMLSQVLASQALAIAAVAERLVSVRDLLLPKLVMGQIDVSALELDALVEESVA
jgi:hypothetical protein